MQRSLIKFLIVTSAVLSLPLHPALGFAQGFTRLQVLLPGESAAPGTATGKFGTPASQVVGIPFNVQVRACDSSWNTVTSITDVVRLTSTDATATLPAATSLQAGTRTLSVTVNAADPSMLDRIKRQSGIGQEIASCHTAKIGPYVIEGHVPAPDIKRLVAEQPDALGLTVPGMPVGSPGMEQGAETEPYDVLLINKDGTTKVFASH